MQDVNYSERQHALLLDLMEGREELTDGGMTTFS